MSDHFYFYRDLSPNATRRAPAPSNMTELEKQAVEHVRRASVKAPEDAILAWVCSIGPESVLSATLSEIRAIANAF